MPTEIVKYVDPDNGILADYTSLQAAITAEKAIRSDLVARDEVLKLMCISSAGSPDTTPVVISEFTTDSTRYIEIAGDNDTGVWDDSKYRIVSNTNAQRAIENFIDIRLSYIQIQNLLDYAGGAFRTYSNTVYVSNCIFKAPLTGVSPWASFVVSGGVAVVKNTLSIGFGYAFYITAGSMTLYNITITGATNAGMYRQGGTLVAKNCISQDNIDNYKGTITGDYNQSDILDAQMPGANSITDSVNFADAANGDFRLIPGSPGIDQGVNLSADPNYPFNTAIDGTLRPQGGAWDIGAFETTNAIELILQDINIPVNLSAGVISQAHQIIADDITIPVNLDAEIITQIHQIVADALNIPVALDNGNLTQTHILAINDMLIAIGLDNMTIIGGSLVNGVAKLQLSITTPGVTPQITLPHIKMTMDN